MAGKQTNMNVYLKLIATQFNKGIKSVQRQIQGFGKWVKGAFALGSITMFGRQMVNLGKDFEDSMARVKAVSNATDKQFKQMEKAAMKMGETTRYTASEAANALEMLTRNGMTAEQATESLSSVLKFAQANAIGLAEAADQLTNVMNMFGMSTKDSERIIDVLSATASHSATNVTELYAALVNAAPAAHTLGFSLEETAAALGALASKGVKAQDAGTQIRMALTKMVDPKIIKKMQEMGIAIDEQSMKEEGLLGTIKRLKDAQLGLTDLVGIFSQRGAVGVQQLINSYDDFVKMVGVTGNATGEATRMFNDGVGTTRAALDELKSVWESTLIKLSNSTSGILNRTIKLITNLLKSLQNSGTRATAIISTVATVITVKLVKSIQAAKVAGVQGAAGMSAFKVAVQSVGTAIKGAFTAMGGWVGLLMTLASVVITKVVDSMHKAKEEARSLQDVTAQANAEAAKEETTLRTLYEIVKDNNKALSVRKKALSDLKSIVSDYHGSLNKEGELIDDNSDAIDRYCKKLYAEMQLEAKKSRLTELYAKREVAINKAKEDALKAKQGPSGFQKFLGVLMSGAASSQEGMMGGMEYHSPKENAQMLADDKADRSNKEVLTIEKQIAEIEADIKDKVTEIFNMGGSITGNDNNGGGGGGGGGSEEETEAEKAQKRFNKALEDYTRAIEDAEKKQSLGLANEEDTMRAKMNATSSVIDAYMEYAHDIQNNALLESDAFKNLVQSYKDLNKANEDLAEARQKAKEAEERQKNAIKAVGETRKNFNESGAKTKNQNPWEGFTTDPKEYKAEQIALEALEKELDRLQSAYDACKNEVEALSQSGTQEAQELLKWYNELGAKLPEQIQKVADARNALYKKKADDQLVELNRDKIDSYYGSVKTLSNGVGTLISSFETLAEADFSDMSLGEQFNTITNAIFGTIDAIKSVIDSFRSLNEIIEAVKVAKESFAAVEAATSGSIIANRAAETAANVAATEAEVAKGAAAETAAAQTVAAATTEVAANTAVAGSGAASSVASVPFVGPILAVAAVAGILGLLATLPKFASGGIVPGVLKHGDKNLARVNSGEMILNNTQQRRLWEIVNGRGVAPGSTEVEFKIRGKDLVAALNNQNASMAKIKGSL